MKLLTVHTSTVSAIVRTIILFIGVTMGLTGCGVIDKHIVCQRNRSSSGIIKASPIIPGGVTNNRVIGKVCRSSSGIIEAPPI